MNNRIYIVFCLVIMTCYVIRPVLPFIEYAINQEYIAKNLCVSRADPDNTCQGSCHLHLQLQKNQAESSPATDNNRDRTDNTKVDDHLAASEIQVPAYGPTIFKWYNTNDPLPASSLDKVFVPPKQ